MPQLLRSFTRSTLLITSLPRLSKTNTFHMGSPSEFKIGVDFAVRLLEVVPSLARSDDSAGTWLRLRMRSIDAARGQPWVVVASAIPIQIRTYLAVSKGLVGGHGRPRRMNR